MDINRFYNEFFVPLGDAIEVDQREDKALIRALRVFGDAEKIVLD